MWTALILLLLEAFHGTVSSSPPINVSFSSVNLRNILHWSPGNGTPDDVHFTVQYAIYGDSVVGSRGRRVNWRAVRHCTEIVRCWCDLSNETWDLEHGYYARVRSVSKRGSSKWAETWRRFDPKSDTSFGPPLVFVDIEQNSAIITIKGAMRYQPNNDTPAVPMATIYNQMFYNLSIRNTRRGLTNHIPLGSSPYKYHLMEYGTEYCFSAKTRLLSMPLKCHSSEWHCINTPPDPVTAQLQKVVVGIIVATVCVAFLVLVGYFLYRYLSGKGQKRPDILKMPSLHPSPLSFLPERTNILFMTFMTDEHFNDKKEISDAKYAKNLPNVADPPPSYSPQRSEPPGEPDDDDSSVDYGFVGMAPRISVSGEAEERVRRDGEENHWNNLKGENQQFVTRDSNMKTEQRMESNHTAGCYASQAKSYLSQTSNHTPIEVSTPVQAHAWSQANSVLNVQANKQGGMGEKIDGGVEEISEHESVPLLSAYASQLSMPTSKPEQSGLLAGDYGFVRADTPNRIEEDDENEEEEGTNCIDWDPITGKLVLPDTMFKEQKGLDGFIQGKKKWDQMVSGEEEEAYVKKGELRLESVLVRQGSEERAEAEREMERRGQPGVEVEDVLTKWDLVIAMDP